MKAAQMWTVYCIDTFGAERKAGEVEAKSKGHAMAIVRKLGTTGVHDAVPSTKEAK